MEAEDGAWSPVESLLEKGAAERANRWTLKALRLNSASDGEEFIENFSGFGGFAFGMERGEFMNAPGPFWTMKRGNF